MVRKLNIEALEAKFPTMPRPESKYLSRIPTLMILSGATGTGKSTNAIELIRLLRREHTITRCFVISPTVVSNQIYGAICTDPERDWKIHLGDNVFDELKRIEAAVEAAAENFRKDLEYAVARKKFTSGDEITPQEETLLEQRSYAPVKLVRPSPVLFVDDAVSSKIYSNSPRNFFTQLCVRCRHIGQQLGLSIIMATQGIKMIPRPIRLVATHWCVYATSSKVERGILFEEVGSAFMPEEAFMRAFEMYTHNAHEYIFLDCIRRSVADSW
jgi:predicted ATPase